MIKGKKRYKYSINLCRTLFFCCMRIRVATVTAQPWQLNGNVLGSLAEVINNTELASFKQKTSMSLLSRKQESRRFDRFLEGTRSVAVASTAIRFVVGNTGSVALIQSLKAEAVKPTGSRCETSSRGSFVGSQTNLKFNLARL